MRGGVASRGSGCDVYIIPCVSTFSCCGRATLSPHLVPRRWQRGRNAHLVEVGHWERRRTPKRQSRTGSPSRWFRGSAGARESGACVLHIACARRPEWTRQRLRKSAQPLSTTSVTCVPGQEPIRTRRHSALLGPNCPSGCRVVSFARPPRALYHYISGDVNKYQIRHLSHPKAQSMSVVEPHISLYEGA